MLHLSEFIVIIILPPLNQIISDSSIIHNLHGHVSCPFVCVDGDDVLACNIKITMSEMS